jgi:hypothetical protein
MDSLKAVNGLLMRVNFRTDLDPDRNDAIETNLDPVS